MRRSCPARQLFRGKKEPCIAPLGFALLFALSPPPLPGVRAEGKERRGASSAVGERAPEPAGAPAPPSPSSSSSHAHAPSLTPRLLGSRFRPRSTPETNACRLVFGPIQQPWTGEAVLACHAARGIEPLHSIARACRPSPKSPRRRSPAPRSRRSSSTLPPEHVSSPACRSRARPSSAWTRAARSTERMRPGSDAELHRRARSSGYAARIGAEVVGGSHAVVAFLMERVGTMGVVREAYAAADDSLPRAHLGRGQRGELGESARARPLGGRDDRGRAERDDARARPRARLEGRRARARPRRRPLREQRGLAHATHTSGGVGEPGQAASVVRRNSSPSRPRRGSELSHGPTGRSPVVDAPTAWSMYPNGLDPAPIAATRGVTPIRVARVRPVDARPDSPRDVTEIGKLDDKGAHSSRSSLSTTGKCLEPLRCRGCARNALDLLHGRGRQLARAPSMPVQLGAQARAHSAQESFLLAGFVGSTPRPVGVPVWTTFAFSRLQMLVSARYTWPSGSAWGRSPVSGGSLMVRRYGLVALFIAASFVTLSACSKPKAGGKCVAGQASCAGRPLGLFLRLRQHLLVTIKWAGRAVRTVARKVACDNEIPRRPAMAVADTPNEEACTAGSQGTPPLRERGLR